MFAGMPYAFWMVVTWCFCSVLSGVFAYVAKRSVATWGIITFLAGPLALYAAYVTNFGPGWADVGLYVSYVSNRSPDWADVGWYASPIVSIGVFIIAAITNANALAPAAGSRAEPAHPQTGSHPPES